MYTELFVDDLVDMADERNLLESLLTELDERSPVESGQVTEYIRRKKAWTPSALVSEKFKDRFGSRQALQKCIALAIALEIPVGVMTQSLGAITETSDWAYGLLHNAKDELTHYEAFTYAAKAYGVTTEQLDEAFSMAKQLNDFVMHPIKLAGSLELGIFFVTLSMLRKVGDAPIKLLVKDVSRDEATHVLTNWHILDELGNTSEGREFRNFRHEVIDWLCDGLTLPKFNLDYWVTQSDKLMANRTAEGLSWTSTGMYLAPFEVDNGNIAGYTSK